MNFFFRRKYVCKSLLATKILAVSPALVLPGDEVSFSMDLSAEHTVVFRQATTADVASIVRLLADDVLGAQRENYTLPLPDSYLAAFEAIDQDPQTTN